MKKKATVSEVREFTRFYTNIIGLLNSHLLNSPYTLPEARVLYEIAQQSGTTAKVLAESLTIDKGYLSRILKTFAKKGIVQKAVNNNDARTMMLKLTKKGKDDFKKLNAASEKQVEALLVNLPPLEQKRLIKHMNAVQSILTVYSPL